MKQLTHFEASLFFAIISVAFLIFIVDFLARPLLGDPGSRWAFWVIQLAIFILLNAVAEVIYIQRAEGIEAMGQSVNFIKENWIEWFTPLLIFFLPLLRINPSEVLVNFAQADPLIPPLPVIAEVGALLSQYAPALGIVGTVLAVAIGNWFMVFRGHLFITLAGSNRRQRIMQYG